MTQEEAETSKQTTNNQKRAESFLVQIHDEPSLSREKFSAPAASLECSLTTEGVHVSHSSKERSQPDQQQQKTSRGKDRQVKAKP